MLPLLSSNISCNRKILIATEIHTMKNDTYTKYAPKLTQHSKFTNIPNTTENLKKKNKKTRRAKDQM